MIDFFNNYKNLYFSKKKLINILLNLNLKESFKSCLLKNYLFIYFVKEKEIVNLNKKFFSSDKITNVFSFTGNKNMKVFGEIIISVDYAMNNTSQKKFSEEIILYLIHGCLHLIGYQDDSEKNIKIMINKENKILAEIKKKHFIWNIFKIVKKNF
jgi:probable rRNA maturation factor